MRILLVVCLALLSSFLSYGQHALADICTDVVRETGLDLNEAECYVLKQVEKGEVAHFKEDAFWKGHLIWTDANFRKRFSKIENRTLSAEFLNNLLTGTLPNLKVTEEGVRIWNARVKEPFYLRNTILPFSVSLYFSIFDKEVDGSRWTYYRNTNKSHSTLVIGDGIQYPDGESNGK